MLCCSNSYKSPYNFNNKNMVCAFKFSKLFRDCYAIRRKTSCSFQVSVFRHSDVVETEKSRVSSPLALSQLVSFSNIARLENSLFTLPMKKKFQ